MKNILRLARILALLFVMGGFQILSANAAWVGPTANPPNGNVAAPINVSDVNQVKEGGLTIGGTVFGQAFTVVKDGDLTINADKFIVTASNGNTTIAGDLSVGGTLTATNVNIGNLTINNLTVNDTLTVNDSTGVDLFKVDGAVGGEDEVRVGPDSGESGMFQAQSQKANVPAILGLKKASYAGSAIVARNSDKDNASFYAENDLGSGIYAQSGAVGYGAILGKSTKGTGNFSLPKNYSAGVRGEANIDNTGSEAITGVLGVASDLQSYENKDVRSFGVVGVGGDISDPAAGNATRLTAGIYGKAGDITGGIIGFPYAITYGVFGEEGKADIGTTWAGYFKGKVKVTGNLETETIANSKTITSQRFIGSADQTPDPVGTFTYNYNGTDSMKIEIGGQNNDDMDQRRFGIRMNGPLALTPFTGSQTPNKQLVFDANYGGYDTYFSYNTDEQCLELWMRTDAVAPNKSSPAGSWLAQDWGESCTHACTGDCSIAGIQACPPGKGVVSGKCAQKEGISINCCGVSPQ